MALNGWRIMWIFAVFDLPTQTKEQRHAYTQFRQTLLKNGFSQLQYSVYIRHCASKESLEVHLKRVKALIPPEGLVSALQVTDKQFGTMVNFIGKASKPPPEAPLQLEFF